MLGLLLAVAFGLVLLITKAEIEDNKAKPMTSDTKVSEG
tara:strand:+ start:583 stop:699 length:117 start_codon:yes stop_codon:yes gene_type:complete